MQTRSFPRHISPAIAALALSVATSSAVRALDQVLDPTGVTQLRAEVPSLTGTGVVIEQPEATFVDSGTNFDHDNYQVDPAFVGSIPLTYIGKTGLSQPYNATGQFSGHASTVASYMAAAAPNLSRIVNSNANWFINSVLLPNNGLQFQPKIINQSFTVDPIDPTGPFSAAAYNQFFDSYVALHGVIMVQAAGDSGPIVDPGMAYNVITVGAYPSATSASSTAGQLAKPDLVTPLRTGDLFTSFAAPTVSGIAALLVQGAGGTGPGVDPRTVKALLINGAVKPAGWTHSATVPLDRQLGAGVVNAYNSYHNLTAGQHTANANTLTTNLGAAHLPVSLPLTVGLAGWNLATITTDTTHDVVDHYLIDLSAAAGNTTLTATLTWLRANNAALTSEYLASNENTTTFTTPLNTINNLDLFLYNADTQSLVDLSNSSIDNVEHLYTLNLAPGKYDLEVLKHGGNTGTADVFSQDETYAVAWNVTGFTAVPEPGSIALMGVGMFAMLRRGRRRT